MSTALKPPAEWVPHAIAALEGYEADYGEPLPNDHELGRIEDSRATPSFRICVGHIRSLADQPAANAEPVAWRPIETAPKDGAVWLYWPEVGDPDERQCVGWWRDDARNGGYWMDFADSDRGTPTHWQPLPAPPGSAAAPPSHDALIALARAEARIAELEAVIEQAEGLQTIGELRAFKAGRDRATETSDV